MGRTEAGTQRNTWWTLGAIFVIAVSITYAWELAQAPLYERTDDFRLMLWHCFVASLGDGLLVLLIFGVGWLVRGQRDWFIKPGIRGYALMLTAGLVIAVAVEWAAVRIAGQWVYNDRMPVVPLLGVGIVPLAQMLLLPPLISHLVARRAAPDTGGSNSPKR